DGKTRPPAAEDRGEHDRSEVADREDEEPVGIRLAPEWIERSPCGGHEGLEDVDSRVDHDPHYVDEMPVDSRNLDAVMMFRAEVPAKRADRREQQQREADEDMRSVQAGQAEEDRRERVVAPREADP